MRQIGSHKHLQHFDMWFFLPSKTYWITRIGTVAIFTKYVNDSQPEKCITFTKLVKAVLKELEGSFAFVFKSKHYPDAHSDLLFWLV
jgi:hypothetical protein